MLIGAGINFLKGLKDSHKFRKLEKEFTAELKSDIWSGLNGFEIFEFRNSLLMTEALMKLEDVKTSIEKLSILKEVLKTMKNEITAAELELKKVNATKLDIATLAVNIQDLTLNSIQEIESLNRHSSNFQNKISVQDSQINKIENDFNLIEKKLHILEQSTSFTEQQIRIINQSIGKINREMSDNVKKLENSLTTIEFIGGALKSHKVSNYFAYFLISVSTLLIYLLIFKII